MIFQQRWVIDRSQLVRNFKLFTLYSKLYPEKLRMIVFQEQSSTFKRIPASTQTKSAHVI